MAHAGQEFALEPVGPLNFSIAPLQFLVGGGQLRGKLFLYRAHLVFDQLAIADVADDRRDAKTVFGFDRAQADLNGKLRAVLALPEKSQSSAHGTRGRVSRTGRDCLRAFRAALRNQHFDRLADQFLAGCIRTAFR